VVLLTGLELMLTLLLPALHFGFVAPNKSKTAIHNNYQLHGHTLEIVDPNKYLGVILTSNLSWDKHVDNVAAKGNRTLGFIRRNLKDCTRTVKETSYTAIVRPTIEYAATVWDPTSQNKIKALENIQRRAARFDTNNYTDRTLGWVTNMITSLGWQSGVNYLQCVAMKLVVGMNSGLGVIRCHSNDCAFARVEAHLPDYRTVGL
jgi:hypothetical protein